MVERVPDDISLIIDVDTNIKEIVFVCPWLNCASFSWNVDEKQIILEFTVELKKLTQNLANTFLLVIRDFIDFLICNKLLLNQVKFSLGVQKWNFCSVLLDSVTILFLYLVNQYRICPIHCLHPFCLDAQLLKIRQILMMNHETKKHQTYRERIQSAVSMMRKCFVPRFQIDGQLSKSRIEEAVRSNKFWIQNLKQFVFAYLDPNLHPFVCDLEL